MVCRKHISETRMYSYLATVKNNMIFLISIAKVKIYANASMD